MRQSSSVSFRNRLHRRFKSGRCPFRASSKQPWQKQEWSLHEKGGTYCAIVLAMDLLRRGGPRLMIDRRNVRHKCSEEHLDLCPGGKYPIRCDADSALAGGVSDEAVPSGPVDDYLALRRSSGSNSLATASACTSSSPLFEDRTDRHTSPSKLALEYATRTQMKSRPLRSAGLYHSRLCHLL